MALSMCRLAAVVLGTSSVTALASDRITNPVVVHTLRGAFSYKF